MLPALSLQASLALAAEGDGSAPQQVFRQGSVLDSSHLVDTALGLIAVLALMLALAWLVKRYVSVPGAGKGQVQVIGGVSLGPRERAVLVSVEGQRLLLGVAPGRVQMLHLLDEQAPPESFADTLQQAGQQPLEDSAS